MVTAKKKISKKAYLKTFTYFIPAPPQRKSGYREVEFDKIMNGILDAGFELEKFNTESVPTGVYVIAILKTHNKKVFEMDLHLDMQERFRLSDSHSSPDIILEDDDV